MTQLARNLIQQWWQLPLPQIIPRDLDLTSYHNLPVRKIVTLTGFRRVGKTYLLLDLVSKIGQKNCLYLNFEDERIPKDITFLTDITDTLTELIGSRPITLLFDEIQNIPNWSLWARRIIEQPNSHQLFLTGSSSVLTSAELPTELRGRSLSITVNPLNFAEFLRFKQQDFMSLTPSNRLHYLREYLTYGGFPEVVLVDPGKKIMIVNEYYNTFVTRDLVEHYKIRNTTLLQNLLQTLLNSPLYTISSLFPDVSKSTLARYLSYLHQSYFVHDIELYTPSLKKRSQARRKPYFIDNSFLELHSTAFSNNLGRLMENLVARALPQAYYWHNYQEQEIDFVLREKEVTQALIQVTYVSQIKDIKEREIRSLISGSQVLRCNNLILITWDLAGKIERGQANIHLIPLADFLLNPSLAYLAHRRVLQLHS